MKATRGNYEAVAGRSGAGERAWESLSIVLAHPEVDHEVRLTVYPDGPGDGFEVAARAQKWVDQAISRNMYLETRDIDEYVEIYSEAWRRGLKTTYYLHVKPRHQSEQTTVSVEKIAEQKIRTGAGKARGFGFAKINK